MEDTLAKVVKEEGKGRPSIVLYEEGVFKEAAGAIFSFLSTESRALMIETAGITPVNWKNLTTELTSLLKTHAVRQASIYAIGDACAIAQSYYLDETKAVRSLVLVDPRTRPHPGRAGKIIDRVEELLPLGLPLRSSAKGFDGRSFLQRIRCPVLIVLTPQPSPFLSQQARLMVSSLPTSWLVRLQNKPTGSLFDPEELREHISVFRQIPAKSPQKNLKVFSNS